MRTSLGFASLPLSELSSTFSEPTFLQGKTVASWNRAVTRPPFAVRLGYSPVSECQWKSAEILLMWLCPSSPSLWSLLTLISATDVWLWFNTYGLARVYWEILTPLKYSGGHLGSLHNSTYNYTCSRAPAKCWAPLIYQGFLAPLTPLCFTAHASERLVSGLQNQIFWLLQALNTPWHTFATERFVQLPVVMSYLKV